MQKLPEAPDWKRGDAYVKKCNCLGKRKKPFSLSAETGELTILKSFLLLVEDPTCPSLVCTQVNLPTSTNHLFYERHTTKNTT